MPDLDKLIIYWNCVLVAYGFTMDTTFKDSLEETINALEELKTLREQSSGGEKE